MYFNFPVLGSEENVPHEHANEVGLKPDEGHDIVVNVHPVFFILGLSKKGRGGEKKKGEKKKKVERIFDKKRNINECAAPSFAV